MITKDTVLPTYEELEVEECKLSTPFLKAGGLYLGKACENINNEFLLCREELHDPRKCIKEGKAVTLCSMNFFRNIKKNCAEEFTDYATCIDKSSPQMHLNRCRKTQAIFDKCMKDKVGMERPPYGYNTEARVHISDRPKPEPEPPTRYPDAAPLPPPPDLPRPPPKYGSRFPFFS